MASLQVLVIDDEAAIRQVLAAQIREEGHQVEHVGTGEAALERLAKGDVDVAICDIRLPDVNGIEVVRRTVALGVETVFMVMTAFASVNTAIEAMKAGAHDYLIKPVRPEELSRRLGQVREIQVLRDENRRLRTLLPEPLKTSCVLPSAAARNVARLAQRVARTEGTVLITGESGTGKGVIAHAIHRQSPRAAAPLVSVNCGAIPNDLLESEFFGHLKGAFTGAERAKKGLMLEADGGTLLLDEIAELPLLLQVKLLHAIEDKAIRPVGGERSRQVNVRILAATNQDLAQLVRDGRFREDLYYRLNVLQIHIPPLRERPEDTKALIAHFLAVAPARLGLEGTFTMEPEAEALLLEYGWPGNVREVQNVIDRALILSDDQRISVSDLPDQVTRPDRDDAVMTRGTGTLRDQSRRFENRVIENAIEAAGGDRRMAAQSLGIGLSTLYRKLEEYASLTGDETGPANDQRKAGA